MKHLRVETGDSTSFLSSFRANVQADANQSSAEPALQFFFSKFKEITLIYKYTRLPKPSAARDYKRAGWLYLC